MLHQWVALSNPDGKDFNEITCYLKLSISVAGPGDEQVQLTDDTGGVDDSAATVLMPASIKKQYKQLYFRIIRGEKLPKTDTFGTIDAYIKTTFNSKTIKTDVIKMKDDLVQWDQEMLLPI